MGEHLSDIRNVNEQEGGKMGEENHSLINISECFRETTSFFSQPALPFSPTSANEPPRPKRNAEIRYAIP